MSSAPDAGAPAPPPVGTSTTTSGQNRTPGYYNRGWNDPPPTAGSPSATPGRKPSRSKYGSPYAAAVSGASMGRVDADAAGPPPMTAPPPVADAPSIAPPAAAAQPGEPAATRTSETPPPSVVGLIATAQALAAAANNNPKLNAKASGDVQRKVAQFVEALQAGALSPPLQAKMTSFLSHLEAREAGLAGEDHRAIVAGHYSELGTWITGFKRLLHAL